jgi:salicylate hydroxylase
MPFIGNGAAQALEDSAVIHAIFAHVQQKEDLTLAFQAFETVRKERSQLVVEASREAGRIDRFDVGHIPGAHPYTRDGIEAIKKRFKEIGAFTNEVDVVEQNMAGVREFERLVKTRHAQRDGIHDWH